MLIWQKHIFKKLCLTFTLFLFFLLTIYICLDLSAHGVRFLSKLSFRELSHFYLFSFSSLLDLFFTLTFLLATMKILHDLNVHREILALQMAGLSKKRLLSPFFYFAAVLSLICYANMQWVYPHSQTAVQSFKNTYKSKKKRVEKVRIHTVPLEDESELIYQSYDPVKKELFDVFWVRSFNDLWHMQTLNTIDLTATFANHLTRKQKMLEKIESFPIKIFTEIPWKEEALLHRIIPFENRSISSLFLEAFAEASDRRIVLTHLYYKLLAPLICFLVVFGIGPVSLKFSRSSPFFLIAAASIFLFITLKIILDGMLILGENQVLPALLAIWSPLLIAFGCYFPAFKRME